jgi:tetratricopeptide (TPR) repeat protein
MIRAPRQDRGARNKPAMRAANLPAMLRPSRGRVAAATFAAAAFVIAAALTGPAAAMGEDPAQPAPAPTACPRGEAVDPKTGLCTKIDALILAPEARYALAFAASRAGRFSDAIRLLDPIAAGRDPRVLTELGYAWRKLGRLDTAIAYYRAALAVDPAAARTRSYLGEGLLAAGRPDLARAELAAIGRICGEGCAPYRTLARAIDARI